VREDARAPAPRSHNQAHRSTTDESAVDYGADLIRGAFELHVYRRGSSSGLSPNSPIRARHYWTLLHRLPMNVLRPNRSAALSAVPSSSWSPRGQLKILRTPEGRAIAPILPDRHGRIKPSPRRRRRERAQCGVRVRSAEVKTRTVPKSDPWARATGQPARRSRSIRSSRGGWVMNRRISPRRVTPEIPKAAIWSGSGSRP
jgi:hypothetical protein